MLPNFIIAGAARSGTTSLYYYLKQHPDISFPSIKEPKYFSCCGKKFPHNGIGDDKVDKKIVKTYKEYVAVYDNVEALKCIGDASSDYLYYHHCSADNILNVLGDIPIIISLRDPVERAVSAYNNLVRDQRENLSFVDALKAEEKRIECNWDWMWLYKRAGLYYEQVKTYKEKFSQVKVIIFDDLISDPTGTLKEIYEFLNVDSSVLVDTKVKYSHSGYASNPIISFLSNINNRYMYFVRETVFDIIPRRYMEAIASCVLKKIDISENQKSVLRDYYLNDIVQLESILGISLSSWKK